MRILLPILLLFTTADLHATFSIVAFDKAAGEWGIAVATNNIYVGNSTIYIRPGLGAFSVIAETEPRYALNGFERLLQGNDIREAIEFTYRQDPDSGSRQVAGIDSLGNTFAFTGAQWTRFEKGSAGHILGKNFVVMGNQLGEKVLHAMASAFESSTGTLAQRLLKAILAGQAAGGQISGQQSAALVVKGSRNEWFNDIDLRVDDSKTPFSDLQRLLNYHYGRIRLNQALNAIYDGNPAKGTTLLIEARDMVKNWNGLQTKIARAWLLLHKEDAAVAVIRAAIAANPKWAVNLPAFYMLKDRPDMKKYIHPEHFSVADWIDAVLTTMDIRGSDAAEKVCACALAAYPVSGPLHDICTPQRKTPAH